MLFGFFEFVLFLCGLKRVFVCLGAGVKALWATFCNLSKKIYLFLFYVISCSFLYKGKKGELRCGCVSPAPKPSSLCEVLKCLSSPLLLFKRLFNSYSLSLLREGGNNLLLSGELDNNYNLTPLNALLSKRGDSGIKSFKLSSLRGDNRGQANFELGNKRINRNIPRRLLAQSSRDEFSLLLCSDLLRVSMDPRGNPEGDVKMRKPEGDNQIIVSKGDDRLSGRSLDDCLRNRGMTVNKNCHNRGMINSIRSYSCLTRVSMEPRVKPEGDDIYCDVSVTMHKLSPFQGQFIFNFNQEKIINKNKKGGIVMNNILGCLYEATKVRLSSLCKIIANTGLELRKVCMPMILGVFLFLPNISHSATAFLPDAQSEEILSLVPAASIDVPLCEEDGYTYYSSGQCPAYYNQDTCVFNDKYLKCDANGWCRDNGYTLSSCSSPKVLNTQCPNGLSLYKSCVCPSTYKYTCNGTGYSLGKGTACDGKYTECVCSVQYNWNGSSCAYCGDAYKYTCSGTGYSGGSGTACGSRYTSCTCASGYHWSGSACVAHSYSCPSGSYESSSSCSYGTSGTVSKKCSCGATSGTCYTCKSCSPLANETGCSYGTKSCSNGCGGTRTCCKTCADNGGSSSCSGQTSACGSGYTQKSSCKDCSGTTRYTCTKNVSCADGGYSASAPSGIRKCETVSYQGLTCYKNCTMTVNIYENWEYAAPNGICSWGPYLSPEYRSTASSLDGGYFDRASCTSSNQNVTSKDVPEGKIVRVASCKYSADVTTYKLCAVYKTSIGSVGSMNCTNDGSDCFVCTVEINAAADHIGYHDYYFLWVSNDTTHIEDSYNNVYATCIQ